MVKNSVVLKTLTALSIVAAPMAASAAEPYIGASFGFVDLAVNGFDEASLNTANARLGLQFTENFSAEIRGGAGSGGDTVNNSVDVELKNFYGAYIRGGIPLGEQFTPYAVIGYTKGKAKYSWSGPFSSDSGSESESDFSFGAGVDVALSDDWEINGEYLSYMDKDEVEVSGFSVGVTLSF